MSKTATTATAPSIPADQRDPNETLQALAAEHGLQIEELDTTNLGEGLRDKFFAMFVASKGDRFIIVPVGQDPAHRLAAVRALLAHPAVTV